MKNAIKFTALAGVAALALSACGSAPEDSADGGSDNVDYKGCMISDAGGFDDNSFNETSYKGLTDAKEDLGISTSQAESKTDADYEPGLANLVNADCDMIVGVGFKLASAVGASAQANEDINYAIVDSAAADDQGNPLELPNVKPISFDTAQAAYLAGYLAAGMTKTGTVATYGGLQIPSVTVFMDGFVDGVAKYNEDKSKDIKVLGWDKAKQNGSFAGTFDEQTKGKDLTETFISQGADIILPVAGPVGNGTLAAARDADGVSVIWVDADGYESSPEFKDLIMTSVVKEMDVAVEDTITADVDGKFDNTPYVGTLENEGVGLSPYHDFDSTIPQELKDEVDQLREDIVGGKITVESDSSPK